MDKVSLNGVEIFPFDSEQQLLHYVDTHKGMLIAINAEKILHATEQTRVIINRNIGYCDGAGAQMALKQKGYIVEKKPDVVFVAMGSPKQELLMEEIQRQHRAIFQGLGGSFDVYTGHVQRAPKWWVEHNLEFAYRLIKEPKRLKRQIHLIRYAWWLLIKKL